MLRFFSPQPTLSVQHHPEEHAPSELTILTPRQGQYRASAPLGQGSSDAATCYHADARHREFVVLAPRTDQAMDAITIIKKHDFFKSVYAPLKTELLYIDHPLQTSYRLIVPRLKGEVLDKLSLEELDQLGDIAQTYRIMAEAYERCHRKNLVYIDTNPGNLLFHFAKQQLKACYLIDGGMAQIFGTAIESPNLKTRVELIAENKIRYPWIAPECWYHQEDRPMADFSMDVFSFGRMAQYIAHVNRWKLPNDLNELLKQCVKTQPSKRPSFSEIQTRLETFNHLHLTTELTCSIM